jgi:hypothetical protein
MTESALFIEEFLELEGKRFGVIQSARFIYCNQSCLGQHILPPQIRIRRRCVVATEPSRYVFEAATPSERHQELVFGAPWVGVGTTTLVQSFDVKSGHTIVAVDAIRHPLKKCALARLFPVKGEYVAVHQSRGFRIGSGLSWCHKKQYHRKNSHGRNYRQQMTLSQRIREAGHG